MYWQFGKQMLTEYHNHFSSVFMESAFTFTFKMQYDKKFTQLAVKGHSTQLVIC